MVRLGGETSNTFVELFEALEGWEVVHRSEPEMVRMLASLEGGEGGSSEAVR